MKILFRRSVLASAVRLTTALWAIGDTTFADTFGTGSYSFTIDFAFVRDAGNPDYVESSPYYPFDGPVGGVAYDFRMGVTEVPQDWMTRAANVIPEPSIGQQPATNVSWRRAAAFVNWLNTSTGHQPAYWFGPGGGGDVSQWSSDEAWDNDPGPGVELNMWRHKDAYYFLPSDDEWFKAAFYKNPGYPGPRADYWAFATATDSPPLPVTGGTTYATAVFDRARNSPAPVNEDGGLSAYGTRGQNGNVAEWLEVDDGPVFRNRGGSWASTSFELSLRGNTYTYGNSSSSAGSPYIGFRVASVPEPSCAMLLLGSSAVLLQRMRRSACRALDRGRK